LTPRATQADSLASWMIRVSLVYIIGYVIWFYRTRSMVARLGDQGSRVMTHWTYVVWRLSLIGAVVLTLVLNSARDQPMTTAQALTDLQARTWDAMILDGARALTGVLLIVALIRMMREVRALSRQPLSQAAA